MSFQAMSVRETVIVDLSEGMWNLAPQPQKILYFHYHNSYSHPTWQGDDGDVT